VSDKDSDLMSDLLLEVMQHHCSGPLE
jgi:hypothetical protein